MIPQPAALAALSNVRSTPISLRRLVGKNHFTKDNSFGGAKAVAIRVARTEVSEPPVWRKGPLPAINPGGPCWVLTFDNWPKCVVYEALVQHVDLTARLYIVTIKHYKLAVSSERVFSMEAAAQQEAALYDTINIALYAAPADGAYDVSEYGKQL